VSNPIEFVKGFLRDPRGVGSVWPSSRFLVQRVIDAGKVDQSKVIVELGPGTGPVTRELLAHMPDDGRLLALEINQEFVDILRREIPDPRLAVHRGPSTEIGEVLAESGIDGADLVVSGIPFSTMPEDEARRTLEAVHAALAPGGRFVAYQVRDAVAERARPIFGEPDSESELLNIPPMRVYTWYR
jgi:phospholipid N-methyltransferase